MPVLVERRVAVTLYYLADEGRMRKVANAFGIGKSTVLKLVRSVIMAISRFLGPQYIKHILRQKKKFKKWPRTYRNSPCVNNLFQFWAVSVHTMPKCFSCRHEKQFGIV